MEKKQIIVSGASKGIGNFLSNKLSQEFDVIGFARTACSKVSSEKFNYVGNVDIKSKKDLKNLTQHIDKKRLYGVINCAGAASMNSFLLTTESMRKHLMDLNFHGTANLIEFGSKYLLKNKKGRIINFSTVAVPLNLAGEAAYVASKAAVEAYTKVIANELSVYNIFVNCLAPGPVETDLIKGLSSEQIFNLKQKLSIKEFTDLNSILESVNFLMNNNVKSLTGQILTFNLAR